MSRNIRIPFFSFYIESFKGLSREMWLLSLATLINRAGTMVVPFLSIYMSKDLGFDLKQIGWIMTCFGLGSLVGSWIGGKLSDLLGYYKVMVGSMLLSGIGFVLLIHFQTFLGVGAAIFVQLILADAFRPAAFTAIDSYSKPHNKVRSISLIRLFINLGWTIGPAIGGFIYYNYGADLLFYLDGITCIFSAFFILIILKPKPALTDAQSSETKTLQTQKISIWRDRPFVLMLVILFIFNVSFFQILATLPLYYKDVHLLNAQVIGWIMACNGFFIFLAEMPIVTYLEMKKVNTLKIILWAAVFLSLSYFILNITMWFGILLVSMLFLTLAEMLGFPFSNSWSLDRAPQGRVGEYMGAYTIAFSLSHIVGPNMGMQISANFGYDWNWYLMTVLGIIAAILTYQLMKMEKGRSDKSTFS